MLIVKQDTSGSKPLLEVGELGYDNYPAGGDIGRVYVGTGSSNVMLAKKTEVVDVDGKVDTHIDRTDNPHSVTKTQVGLGNVDNTADADKNVLSATKWTTARTISLTGDVTGSTSIDGSGNVSITAVVVDDSHNHVITNVDGLQDALDLKADKATTYTKTEVDSALALKVDDAEIASVNLLRADKYLAAQNIANMSYTDGNLTKIQYNNVTDVDYEVFGYVSGNLASIQHYVGSVLKGTTTLSYTDGNLVSAIFVGV